MDRRFADDEKNVCLRDIFDDENAMIMSTAAAVQSGLPALELLLGPLPAFCFLGESIADVDSEMVGCRERSMLIIIEVKCAEDDLIPKVFLAEIELEH